MTLSNLLWSPTKEDIDQANVTHLISTINEKFELNIENYDQLWKWSIQDIEQFWHFLINYFHVKHTGEVHPVMLGPSMEQTQWFPNLKINLAECFFDQKSDLDVAIIETNESGTIKEYTWSEIHQLTAGMQQYLSALGLKEGDRICGVLANRMETTVCMLACVASGFIWSSCAPEFGLDSMMDRFSQIEPKVLFSISKYTYGGKEFDISEKVKLLHEQLPTIRHRVDCDPFSIASNAFSTITHHDRVSKLKFASVDFSYPLWILYSSGTTGKPKAITHSQGGILMELWKYHAFQNNVKSGQRYFWYSTTGWMMWNFMHGAWLQNASIVLYDGSPVFPSSDHLWSLVEKVGINHFGTSAPFILACMKNEVKPNQQYRLDSLISIGSTGAPLPPEGFKYIYEHIKSDVWLTSMSGGTDVCTAFVGGCPTEPVYEGIIQRRALGCSLFAWDETGKSLVGEQGEMVITKSMPSMPIFFWNDKNHEKYHESYFDMFPGIWRHGDWIEITEDQGVIIFGRSDTTLNRGGIRIGTAEIYNILDRITRIKDSLIVNIEYDNGTHYMPLFITLREGETFDEKLRDEIVSMLKNNATPRHVPDEILVLEDIPYTLSGKKMENPVKKILSKRKIDIAATKDTMRNPESLDPFIAMDISQKGK